MENKPASSLVVSLGKALNGTPHLYVEDWWPRHLENSNSQAVACRGLVMPGANCLIACPLPNCQVLKNVTKRDT